MSDLHLSWNASKWVSLFLLQDCVSCLPVFLDSTYLFHRQKTGAALNSSVGIRTLTWPVCIMRKTWQWSINLQRDFTVFGLDSSLTLKHGGGLWNTRITMLKEGLSSECGLVMNPMLVQDTTKHVWQCSQVGNGQIRRAVSHTHSSATTKVMKNSYVVIKTLALTYSMLFY